MIQVHVHIYILDAIHCYVVIGLMHIMEGLLVIYISNICDTCYNAIKYLEVRDWICLQDQTTLTYQSLLAYCKQLEARCEQFQQARAQGRAHLTTITATSSTHSSLHANTQSPTTCQPCSRCSYSQPMAPVQPLTMCNIIVSVPLYR